MTLLYARSDEWKSCCTVSVLRAFTVVWTLSVNNNQFLPIHICLYLEVTEAVHKQSSGVVRPRVLPITHLANLCMALGLPVIQPCVSQLTMA